MRQKKQQPRMHSSRMRAVRSSGRLRRGGGGCMPRRGVVCPGGGSGIHPPPPVDRMADACEDITLPQLRCGW